MSGQYQKLYSNTTMLASSTQPERVPPIEAVRVRHPLASKQGGRLDPAGQLIYVLECTSDTKACKDALNKQSYLYFAERSDEAIGDSLYAVIRHSFSDTALLKYVLGDEYKLENRFRESLAKDITCPERSIMRHILEQADGIADANVARVLKLVLEAVKRESDARPRSRGQEARWEYFLCGPVKIKTMQHDGVTPLEYALEVSCLPKTAEILLKQGATLREHTLALTGDLFPSLEIRMFVAGNRAWVDIDDKTYNKFLSSCWAADMNLVGNPQVMRDHWLELFDGVIARATERDLFVGGYGGKKPKIDVRKLTSALYFMWNAERDPQKVKWRRGSFERWLNLLQNLRVQQIEESNSTRGTQRHYM